MERYSTSDDSSVYKNITLNEPYEDVVCLDYPHGWTGGVTAKSGKVGTLITSTSSNLSLVFPNGVVRKFTPEEFEMLQTVPVGYTKCVSNTQRYKMLGNGWTVDVIAHIFKNL